MIWTPVDATGPLWGVWTPRGLQDSTPETARGVLLRARLLAPLEYHLLERTTIGSI